MSTLLAALRLPLVLLVVAVGTLVVLPFALVPMRVRGARLASWGVTAICRSVLGVAGLSVRCPDRHVFETHGGFVFPNHLSYTDIVVLQSVRPLRFLSNHKVRRWPFIGGLAHAVGTVFVDRDSLRSRARALVQMAGALDEAPRPPLVLFPEGGLGTPGLLRPFQKGAFSIAAKHRLPFLPVALDYARPDVVHWHDDESLPAALRRLCGVPHHTVTVHPLPPVHPRPESDADALAEEARAAIAGALHHKVPVPAD